MSTVCPDCHRALPESSDPPRYCSYCGAKLRTSSVQKASLEATGNYTPQATWLNSSDDHPEQIGNYRIIRHLGSGGMGRVYEAEPLQGGPAVAVKVLSQRLQTNPASVERFRQEGRLAGQIAHPRCVFVMGADADRGQPYIVMELMPGDTLKDLVDRRGAIPANEAIRLTLDVIEGLREAHRLGVIHRDIKPSNCFLMPDGRVKVGDFGLSKSLDSTQQLTTSGAFLGTILYASPEQIRGESVDFASDVYSLGATLYHLLTGRAPFQHENPTAVLAKIISEDPPPIRDINASVPPDLAKVVHRSLERDRSRRYASLAEFEAALRALLPTQLTFGSMGIRVGAYLLDEIIVRMLLVGPMFFLITKVLRPGAVAETVTMLTTLFLYFVITEGLFGRTIGKALLGLRVVAHGTTLSPGLKRVAIRSIIFLVIFSLTFSPIANTILKAYQGRLSFLLFFWLIPWFIGVSALFLPIWRRKDFRGVHELFSNTSVLRAAPQLKAIKLHPNAIDRLAEIPRRPLDFPDSIGSYLISRAMKTQTGWIAIGEDPLLGRKVLLSLASTTTPDRFPPLGRPGRMWSLGIGNITVGEERFRWHAYVAPMGSPIVDAVDTDEPVRWPEARPILEQLATELLQAEKDSTVPDGLTLDQIWVNAEGRVQLLEVPFKQAKSPGSVELLRQATAVLLEGQPRKPNEKFAIRAPLPKHAEKLLNQLYRAPNNLATLQHFLDELDQSRDAQPRISRPIRTVQLALLAVFKLIPLLVMFGVSAFYSFVILIEEQEEFSAAYDRIALATEAIEELETNDPALIQQLQDRIQQEKDLIERICPGRTSLEDLIFMKQSEQKVNNLTGPFSPLAREMLQKPPPKVEPVPRAWGVEIRDLMLWPLLMAVFSFTTRGIVFRTVLGVRCVRTTGGLAYRRQYALKAFLFWLPICILLSIVIILRANYPEMSVLWEVIWLVAASILPLSVGITMIEPERTWLDRIAGTWLVPN